MTDQQQYPLTPPPEQPMTHPLTDKIIEQILGLPIKNLSEGERYFAIHAARGSADWQLEQVIEFLEDNKKFGHFDLSVETALRFIRPAMRPQENN